MIFGGFCFRTGREIHTGLFAVMHGTTAGYQI